VTRFECTNGLTCFMDIYEVEKGNRALALADSLSLQIPGIADEMGNYGSTAAGFIFQSDGKWYMGVESYQAFDGSKIAVNVFTYDGSTIDFVRGAGYEEWGEGSIFIKDTGKPSLNSLDAGWDTVKVYDIEANDWGAPTDEEFQRLISSYSGILREAGLILKNDSRFYSVPEKGILDSYDRGEVTWYAGKYQQKSTAVYGTTEKFTPLWRIASWQSENGVLFLERENEEPSGI